MAGVSTRPFQNSHAMKYGLFLAQTNTNNITPAQIARLAQGDPAFHAKISDVTLFPGGDLRARIPDPSVTLRFVPGLSSGRLHTGLRVLADALGRFEGGDVTDLDLRYEDQVVVRFSSARGN